MALAERPVGHQTSSLPRNGPLALQRRAYFHASEDDSNDAGEETQTDALPARGAIDIVKGLEKKRQRRKEKFFQKNCNRKNKGDRKPQPGKGAERMEQLGLLLSGKTGARDPYMMSA